MVKATVAAILTNADKTQILLTRRGIPPFKGFWCLPGGHIDRYEGVQDAIVREVKEETGLDFTPRFYSFFDEIMPDHDNHAVVLVFEGVAFGSAAAQPGEVDEVRWFSPEEIENLSLAFQHADP